MTRKRSRIFETWATSSSLLLAAATGCGAPEPELLAERVLLVSCDTLRADRLGLYGYDAPTSPSLDAFAAESVVFDEAYACAPFTNPSVSTLLSGRFPDEMGVLEGNRVLMPTEIETLAERLAARGFATGAIVSNWVLRRVQLESGEDIGFAQGFQHYDDRMQAKELNRDKYERLADETTDDAIAWLEEREAAGEERFFLWVHYQDPHGPYTPPETWSEQFPAPAPKKPLLPVGKTQRGLGQLPNYQALDGRRDAGYYRARYDAEIRFFDEELGRLFAWLEERRWFDDAIVIFTSDHGESMGEHNYWFSHGEHVYRDVVRVPLIVRTPLGAPGRTQHPASLVDVVPTILTELGLDASDLPGSSLLRERKRPAALQSLGLPGSGRRWDGWVEGNHHLVIDPTGRARLYDLEADPLETNDLADELPGRVAELRARLEARKAGLVTRAGVRREMRGEDEDAFRHLGYAGDEPDDPDPGSTGDDDEEE